MKYFLLLLTLYFLTPAFAQTVPTSPRQIELSFAPVVKKVAPAVVNIYTKQRVEVSSPLSPFMGDPFFQQFFGRSFGGGALTRERVVQSLGSGVIVKANGLVVTSHHVIKGADDIRVVLADRREMKAKVAVTDTSSDLALLQLETEGAALPVLPIGNSDALEVGDLVLALGNPFGVGQTVTSGIVSALARPAGGVSDYNFFIQTDAAINPGNSGGALVNLKGELIGINTAIYSKTGGSLGIGFAIPANMLSALLAGSQSGTVSRPWLGAVYQPLTTEAAESLGIKSLSGVLVAQVMPESPAARAGLKEGDIITRFDDVAVDSPEALKFRIATASTEKPVSLSVKRHGREEMLQATLIAPPENPPRDTRLLKGPQPLAGVVVMNLSPRVADQLGLPSDKTGVVVVEDRGTQFGFVKGDIFLAVNGKPVTSTKNLQQLMSAGRGRWSIVFARGDQKLNLRVE